MWCVICLVDSMFGCLPTIESSLLYIAGSLVWHFLWSVLWTWHPMFKKYTFLKLKGSGANYSQADSKAKPALKFVFILGTAPIWAGFIVSVSWLSLAYRRLCRDRSWRGCVLSYREHRNEQTGSRASLCGLWINSCNISECSQQPMCESRYSQIRSQDSILSQQGPWNLDSDCYFLWTSVTLLRFTTPSLFPQFHCPLFFWNLLNVWYISHKIPVYQQWEF